MVSATAKNILETQNLQNLSIFRFWADFDLVIAESSPQHVLWATTVRLITILTTSELCIKQSSLLIKFYVFHWTLPSLHLKVTIDLELCLNKKTKFKSSRRPAAKYDVYLYRTPQTKAQVPNGESVGTVSNGSRSKGRVLRWEEDLYPPSPPCSPVSVRSQRPRPRTVRPYDLWQLVPSHVPVTDDCGHEFMTEFVAFFIFVFWSLWEELKLKWRKKNFLWILPSVL